MPQLDPAADVPAETRADTPAGARTDSAARLAASDPETLAAATTDAIDTARGHIDQVTGGGLLGEEVLHAYDQALAALARALGVSRLVSKAHPEPSMRAAADAAEQELSKVTTEISLDRGLYDALTAVDLDAIGADPATRHWMARTLRDFRRSGVDRDEATRARARALQEELVSLGQSFARNINSGTRSVRLPPQALAGLPDDWVRARPPDAAGLVTVTTDTPDAVPFLTYAHDEQARAQLLRQWRRCGHPANIDVLRNLLACRHELATLLGYPNWAAYVTEDKMIGTEQAAGEFIAEISAAAEERMRHDYQALLARKQAGDPGAQTVAAWDSRYLIEQVKKARYAVDTQALRPYFEYRQVKAGLLALSGRLFGISFEPRPDLPVWHPDVEVYDVCEGGQVRGRIFLDMHPRPDKFSHAAMFPMVMGQAGGPVPECALLCNFPRPGAEPALLEPGDVRTFFHEFGHMLHHVFGGQQRWSGISGIRTERDFIEAPSQLLEEWMRDPSILASFAVHHQTGEPLPAELARALHAADEFGRGLWVRQQMFYAALSLELHRRDPATLDPLAVEQETEARHAPYASMDGAHLHLSFGHLDQYSATYYTYMWSLVIAKDLFTGFDPAALEDPEPAARYRRAVLEAGGSAPAAELVREFLGREYTYDAYRHWLDG